jgi:cation diffusion facilitator CzcD-associated flavoprotein CzcO
MEQVDVVIVGAGLSGVSAAWHLQRACPWLTYTIVEARDAMGGTWDLFRYPGIRSDSDMYTLGYRFRPWREAKAIADGPSIKRYIETTARESGIDRHIRFGHRVTAAAWSSDTARWTVTLAVGAEARQEQLSCAFVFNCSGYYDYRSGYTPTWEGMAQYRGRVVHPQQWPADLDYAGKRVLVIGSGATAVTLVPAMTTGPGAAQHVTMLQRSPSYVASLPTHDTIAAALRRVLPAGLAHMAIRWKNILRSMFYFWVARSRPDTFKRGLRQEAVKQLGADYPVDVHFAPRYNPWDERLCIIPDGDLFHALRAGRATIVTDQIAHFTERGVRLTSGQEIDADVIVTATGLRMSLLTGVALTVDGVPFDLRDQFVYKGLMLSNLPNFAMAVGYTNASWTLKSDLIAQHVCRLLRYMRRRGYRQVTPRCEAGMPGRSVFDFTSGYVQRAQAVLPRQGDARPWRLYQNYLKDLLMLRHGRVADPALEFRGGPTAAGAGA